MLEQFNKHFEILEATTPELELEAFKLRYQVFCNEANFVEPIETEIETDEYDYRSIQYLVRHRRTNSYAATCRFVLPVDSDPLTPFPFEPSCISANSIPSLIMPDYRLNIGELSRVSVSKAFTKQDHFSAEEKKLLPLLYVSLVSCAVAACTQHNISYICGCMEPRSIRFFSMIGVSMTKLGSLYEYRGVNRFPVLCNLLGEIDKVKDRNIQYWNLITNNGQYHL